MGCLVYSLTNYEMDIQKQQTNGKSETITNGKMEPILSECLANYRNNNDNINRDYYYLVIDKKNNSNIIINSIKGLTKLTPNINNLPFQIKWKDNQTFKYQNPIVVKKMIIEAIKNSNPSWKEKLCNKVRLINIE